MELNNEILVLPEILSASGFSLETHLFRYRNDNLIRNDDGSFEYGYGARELLESIIWHSCVGALNDPFEVYFQQNKNELYELTDEELFFYWSNSLEKNKFEQKIMSDFFSDNKDDIRSQLTSNIGSYIHIFKEIFRKHAAIACFTTCCDSRLMWGYYCSGLKGFCLIYNTERINRILPQVSKVIYSKERPTLGVMSYFIRKMRGESVFAIESFAKYKHEEWSHENEYRSFLMLDDENDIVSGGVSVQLNESCIDGVIIGEECNEQTKRAIIGYSKDKGIKVFHASADLDIFRVYIS